MKSTRYRKPYLPEKICLRCGRSFAWRKKWERCWEQVRYCSNACRRSRSGTVPEGSSKAG